MMLNKLHLGLLMVAGLVGLSGATVRADETIEQRVEKLEKLVIRDPFRPRENVLDRLAAVEQHIETMTTENQTAAREDRRSDDELDRTLKLMERYHKETDSRLDKLERQPAGGGDLREIQRSLDAMERALSSLKDRVSRLENKR